MGSTRRSSERAFDVIHPKAAGIDIGSKRHYVAVDPSVTTEPVRSFGAYTTDLFEMGRWLVACGVQSIAMEATGVYWVPVARVLEEEFQLEVRLVDPKHVRALPGRKTDIKDCQWIQQLHSHGLLSGVFRPAAEIQPLKSLWRQRKALVASAAQHIHRIQKALEVMNIQLHKALSDITGVTGMKILRAIVAGERDPKALASLRCTRVKKTDAEIVDALTGNFLPDQVFALTQALEGYDFFQAQMKACDAQIERYVATLATRPPFDPNAPAVQPAATAYRRPRRKNQVHFNLRDELVRISGVDLTRITGIDELTAQTVIAEVGVDVSAFRTEKHFASWLALAPNHQITGGRVRRRTTRPSASRLAASLRVAAQALHRSKSALGAFYRRMRARLGAPKAITAAAHKLAILIYRMLKHGEAFVERGQSWYEENYKQRAIASLHRNARTLGFQLVPSSVS